MRKVFLVIVILAMAVPLSAQQPRFSVGTRLGMAAPETAEIIAAYRLTGEETPVISLSPLAVYAAAGGGIRGEDFGMATVGAEVWPYPNETNLRALSFYVGATLGWRDGTPWDSNNLVIKWRNDEMALGLEAGAALSPFDPDSGAFGTSGYLLPRFSLGLNSVTGKIVAGFQVAWYQ